MNDKKNTDIDIRITGDQSGNMNTAGRDLIINPKQVIVTIGLIFVAMFALLVTYQAIGRLTVVQDEQQVAEDVRDIALTQQAEAETLRDIAVRENEANLLAFEAQRIAIDNDSHVSLQKSVTAFNLAQTPTTYESLVNILSQYKPHIIFEGHSNAVKSVAFSFDGSKLVTASVDGTAIIWDTKTWQPITVIDGHSDQVIDAVFSPDDSQVVTASLDNTAILWNAKTWQPLATLTGHTGGINSVAFNPDGSKIITSSADGTARIWLIDPDQLLDLAAYYLELAGVDVDN